MELSANNSHYDCNENFIFKTANGSKIEVSKKKIEEIKSLLWNEMNDSKNQILKQNRIVNLKKNDDKTVDDLLDFYVDEFYDDLFIISNEDSLEKYEVFDFDLLKILFFSSINRFRIYLKDIPREILIIHPIHPMIMR